ncbi:MAG: bifunctional enzyme CysN/CysC [Actinomycetota bacterium]|jgi:sulfate adenylyltransferase large subunit|nr:bifunctional enzyme CysN/CysC [Actinomycetota bacterium]
MADLLRFATAGSVDDGKSTLIGRLLYDSKSVFQDQLAAVERTSADRGDDYTNLALLTDGLRAEREQGITIDVAYRYFSTPVRSFIVADTPGHVQYTRNMVTGASTADLALVLVDARKGVVEQTRRHASLSALLRVPHLVLAVNKMDLVDFDQATYDAIVSDFRAFAAKLDLPDVTAIPIAALQGDNVVHRSDAMPWYDGPALLEHLEQVHVSREDAQPRPARFPVQYVIRPMSKERPDYRGYAGTLASGTLNVGDEVVVLPSGRRTTVEAIDVFEDSLATAVTGQAVTVRLAEELDVSRGDMIVAADAAPTVTSSFDATVCWMSDAPLQPGQRVLVKQTTRTVKAQVQTLHDRLDVTQLQAEPSETLRLNDIGRVTVRTAQPLALDAYADDRTTGAFIVLDEATGTTLGAGMVA